MRFLVDECTGQKVAVWLRGLSHDVFSVFEQARGSEDEAMLLQAVAEDRIVITNDKDFGDLVFRDKKPHKGVVLLRLDDERSANKIARLQHLLQYHAGQLAGRFIVVTETTIRIVTP
jgi:predicted nuclease of predicted toxin-antitoxin system